MKIRMLKASDIAKLEEMHAKSGFAYQFPNLYGPLIETVQVIADDDDEPIIAVAAERITQLYLWCKDGLSPTVKMHAIQALHQSMAIDLRAKGYTEVNCFLPQEVAKSFGSRLKRSFGWTANWPSLCRKF